MNRMVVNGKMDRMLTVRTWRQALSSPTTARWMHILAHRRRGWRVVNVRCDASTTSYGPRAICVVHVHVTWRRWCCGYATHTHIAAPPNMQSGARSTLLAFWAILHTYNEIIWCMQVFGGCLSHRRQSQKARMAKNADHIYRKSMQSAYGHGLLLSPHMKSFEPICVCVCCVWHIRLRQHGCIQRETWKRKMYSTSRTTTSNITLHVVALLCICGFMACTTLPARLAHHPHTTNVDSN